MYVEDKYKLISKSTFIYIIFLTYKCSYMSGSLLKLDN